MSRSQGHARQPCGTISLRLCRRAMRRSRTAVSSRDDTTVHDCLMPRLHQDTRCLIQVVSTCIHLSPSICFLYRRQNCRQFVARLLLNTKGYKSTATSMNSNYVAEIQSTSIPDEQLVSGDIYVSGYKLLVRDTCFRATCVLV